MKTMIALVSDQRMQNVIPILQENASYDHLVLILSKERKTGKPQVRYSQSANDLQTVLQKRLSVELSDAYVDPFDIEDIVQKIGHLIQKYQPKGDVLLNMSGGTKPMAIGALQAARAAGIKSLYTNTEDKELIWLNPDDTVTVEKFRVAGLDVATYLRAYGQTIKKAISVMDIAPQQMKWADLIGDNHQVIYSSVVNAVCDQMKRQAREKSLTWPLELSLASLTRRQRCLVQQLQEAGLWEWDEGQSLLRVPDLLSGSFLNGNWVEVYVARRLQETTLFDDVCLNVELEGVAGEIDVAAVANGKLVLIECKSNVQQTEQLGKLVANQTLLGGPFAQAYYARASKAGSRQIRTQVLAKGLNGAFFGDELKLMGIEISRSLGAG